LLSTRGEPSPLSVAEQLRTDDLLAGELPAIELHSRGKWRRIG
jgi:hypothetical protein